MFLCYSVGDGRAESDVTALQKQLSDSKDQVGRHFLLFVFHRISGFINDIVLLVELRRNGVIRFKCKSEWCCDKLSINPTCTCMYIVQLKIQHSVNA